MSDPAVESFERTILVVCTANIYRSPIVEAFIRHSLYEDKLDARINVLSAGMDARPGIKVPLELVSHILDTYALDLSRHKSQPVTTKLFQTADLVLVMEQQHLERLSKQYPRHSHKIRLMSELSGKVYDIIDPGTNPHISLIRLSSELKALIQPNLFTILKWLRPK